MRFLLSLLTVFATSQAFAQIYSEEEIVKELPSTEYGVFRFEVTTKDEGSIQAANLTRPNLSAIYERLLQTNGALKTQVEKIYEANDCTPDGKYKDGDDMFCGSVSTLDEGNTVLWSYGRGGWASAGAMFKSFLTFTGAGTGRYTDAVLEVTTSVSVEAHQLEEGKPAVFDVVIDMSKFKEIEQEFEGVEK
ncbi:MAG: hypothetical protein AB7F86_18550 [Bdellovibrionales bacterium]